MLLHNKINRTDNELGGTHYEVNEVKGQKTVSISHNLCDVARGYRASWDESTLERMLKQSCYASLLPYDASCIHMPFDPLVEIKVCLGLCPPVKVSSDVLPPPPAPPQQPSENSLTENNVDIFEELLDDDDNSLLDPEYEMSEDNTSDEESLVGDEYVSLKTTKMTIKHNVPTPKVYFILSYMCVSEDQ